MTLAAIARESIRESKRLDLSGQAIALFQSYAASHRNEPLYFEAMSSAGSLLSEQALSKLAQAKRLPAGASRERESLRTEARAGFDSAAKVTRRFFEQERR